MKDKMLLMVLWAAAAGLSGFAVGCAEDDPETSDYDEYAVWVDDSADFSKYETFGFQDIPDDQLDRVPEYVVTNNARIRNLVTAEMEQLGLSESDDNPDLLVSSLAYSEDYEAYYYDCVSGVYWWGYWPAYSGCAWLDVDYVEFDVGTIIIPIGDTASQTIVFLGMMQGIVDSSSDGEQRIEDGLNYIFNHWPEN